jgi:hypothetical protein
MSKLAANAARYQGNTIISQIIFKAQDRRYGTTSSEQNVFNANIP